MARLKKSERRKQIIETAARVFAERGLAGTRTREIANACGVNEALLYKHFRSKEEVFREVMEYIHTGFVKSWHKVISDAPDGKTALVRLTELQAANVYARPAICANILHSLAAATGDCDDEMHEVFTKWFVEHHKIMERVIRRGVEDGSLKQDIDPARTAWMFRGIAAATIIMSATGRETALNVVTATKTYTDLLKFITSELPHQEPGKAV